MDSDEGMQEGPPDHSAASSSSSSSSSAGVSWSARRPTHTDATRRQLHHLLDRFCIADQDGNGILDREEVRTLLQTDVRCQASICMLARQHQWLSDGDLDEIMQSYDGTGKGGLTFNEFMALVQDGVLLDGTFDEYRAVFAAADLDGDGTLDVAELTLVLQQLGKPITPAEVQAIMQDADLDNNRRIDFNEFLRLFHAELLNLPRMLRYIKMRPLVFGEEATPTAGWAHSLSSGSLTLVSGAAQWHGIMQGVAPSTLLVAMFGLSGDVLCQTVATTVADLAAAYRSCVFVQLHVDASPDVKDLFKNVLLGRATPAFFFFRGGHLLHSHASPSAAVLEHHLREHVPVTEQPLRLVVQPSSDVVAGVAHAGLDAVRSLGHGNGPSPQQPPQQHKPTTGFSMADLVYNID